jgi:NTP pyrophosphatase (non-canonical NTP hydrolase)
MTHAAQPIEAHEDSSTTVAELKTLMAGFVEARQWWKYHTPKNLAISISLEANELLEHFQWTHPEEELSAPKKQMVAEEMADVLAYLMSMANVLNIDVAQVYKQKMLKNAQKYPSERFQGTWEKIRHSKPFE